MSSKNTSAATTNIPKDSRKNVNDSNSKSKFNEVIDKPINMNLKDVNDKIKKDFCKETAEYLTDSSLMSEYVNSYSVKEKFNNIKNILSECCDEVDIEEFEDEKEKLINSMMKKLSLSIIPPGTKGVIRGNKFNTIIKDMIESMELSEEEYEVAFEKKYHEYETSERPDWYILHKETKKVIIGMNQLSIVGGGQQLNRGSKYISNSSKFNDDKCKLLCVICNYEQFKSKNKSFKLFKEGFENKTLVYPKTLKNSILEYFK